MVETNPYAPPKAVVADTPIAAPELSRLNRVASGQRLLLAGLIANLGATAAQALVGPAALIFSLAAIGLAMTGIVRASGALGSSALGRGLYALLMLVPLLNLLMMAIVSGRATRALRAGGYQVGLLGANQREA